MTGLGNPQGNSENVFPFPQYLGENKSNRSTEPVNGLPVDGPNEDFFAVDRDAEVGGQQYLHHTPPKQRLRSTTPAPHPT